MIAIGCDHGGYLLKEDLKKYLDEIGLEYEDFGTYSIERTDYPIYAKKVAEAVSNGTCEKGIIACRSGHGVALVANKFRGIRAANISSEEDARLAKADDDINIITIGGDFIETDKAIRIIRTWLATEFKGGRYEERIKMIEEIENNNMK